MTASSAPRHRSFAVIFFVAILAAVVFIVAFAALHPREWAVPLDAKTWANPLTPADFNAGRARELYRQKCASCHGKSGKGDGDDAPLWGPRPTNFTDTARLNSQSDGELFYKITEGKRPMPGFKHRLTDLQRWELVLFLRSLSSALPAPLPQADQAKAPSSLRAVAKEP